MTGADTINNINIIINNFLGNLKLFFFEALVLFFLPGILLSSSSVPVSSSIISSWKFSFPMFSSFNKLSGSVVAGSISCVKSSCVPPFTPGCKFVLLL